MSVAEPIFTEDHVQSLRLSKYGELQNQSDVFGFSVKKIGLGFRALSLGVQSLGYPALEGPLKLESLLCKP